MGEYLHSAAPDSRIMKLAYVSFDLVPDVTAAEQHAVAICVGEYSLRQKIEHEETKRVLSILGLV